MAKCKNFDVDTLIPSNDNARRKTHFQRLYDIVMTMDEPIILEFGVSKGMSTCLLSAAAENRGGQLFSVDVRDFSDAVESDVWTFILESDLDVSAVIEKAPQLQDGIDLLMIDSLHTYDHVRQQLQLWYPYVKQGGYITFDDIDEIPYLPGQPRSNYIATRTQMGVARAVREFFYGNRDDLDLEFNFGETGFATMRKYAPQGQPSNAPFVMRQFNIIQRGRDRLSYIFWSALLPLRRWLIRRFPNTQQRIKTFIQKNLPFLIKSKNRY